MSKRAVLYARVSGDDRGKDGRNLKGQLDMGRDHCLKHGHRIVAELSEDDKGASGASLELPQLNKALQMAQTKQFDVFVVREIDRLSRNLAKQLIVEDGFKRAGVEIEYVLGEYPDTPEGSLMKHVRASVSEYERLKIIERMVRGRYLKVKSGSVLVAQHPPYGYTVVPSGDGKKFMLVVQKSQSKIVILIFSWFTLGAGDGLPLDMREIARRLNEMGIPTSAKPIAGNVSGTWTNVTIHHILRNETYAGVWTYGKRGRKHTNPSENYVRVDVPPIVARDVWELAQRRLRRNSELARRHTQHDYLMARRLRCGSCGKTLYGKPQPFKNDKKVYRYCYYMCVDCRSGNVRCKGMRANVELVDGVVWEWVKSLLLDPNQLEKGLTAFQKERGHVTEPFLKQLQITEDLLAQNQVQLKRLIDLYLSGEFEQDVLLERKHRLENTIEDLKKERREIEAQIEMQTLTASQQRTLEEFGEAVRKQLPLAEKNFKVKRQIIDLLDMTGQLVAENGRRVIYARCSVATNISSIKNVSTGAT